MQYDMWYSITLYNNMKTTKRAEDDMKAERRDPSDWTLDLSIRFWRVLAAYTQSAWRHNAYVGRGLEAVKRVRFLTSVT